ncbi:MAG: hypothetical protein M1833_004763 [Piccolia ochrophora]|nr:MAG: hypothetical protein M1833_004763 [Piccolia ochrophora]
MLNTEDEAPLKKWIVKRLEDISDADSDVLADYVLALLRHESPESEVRALSIEQLEDFLKDNTAKFVDDIFRAIKTKSYLPGAAAGSIFNEPSASIPPTSPAQQLPYEPAGLIPNGGARGRPNGSRKRSYNEREGSETNDGRDPHYAPNTADRIHKQARRGGLRNGRGENMDNRGRRSLGPQLGQGPDAVGAGVPGLSQSPPLAFPGMPPPPPGFPFNPNDPLAAVMAMQAMGFPSLPPMSPFSPTGSPAALAADVGTRRPPSGVKTTPERKNGKRCRDYDEKGFCAMGGTCPYEHGLDHIIVPGQNDGKFTFSLSYQKSMLMEV